MTHIIRHAYLRHLFVVALAYILLLDVACNKGSNSIGNTTSSGSSEVADVAVDPEAELRAFVADAKEEAAETAGDRLTFVDVRVETIKSSSLTYPYLGRIMADYKNNDTGNPSRCVVYVKYSGEKWLFAKYDTGPPGAFSGPLADEDEVLSPPIDPAYSKPTGAHTRFTNWNPELPRY